MKLLLAGVLSIALLNGCTKLKQLTEKPKGKGLKVEQLVIKDLIDGKGQLAEKGKSVKVHYTGWLYDPKADNQRGKKFDSSKDRDQPFTFALGAGQVIPGWDEGVAGMKVEGKRELIIPPDKAYGAAGAGGVIPPNATLLFEVELLEVN